MITIFLSYYYSNQVAKLGNLIAPLRLPCINDPFNDVIKEVILFFKIKQKNTHVIYLLLLFYDILKPSLNI